MIDLIIVGAGPVGLFCANEAIRHGLECRIIDKKSALSDKSKALGLHIKTLDILDDCGFIEAIIKQGHKVSGALFKSAHKTIARIGFKDLSATRHFLIDLPQNQTEQIFYQGLVDKSQAVEWQSELIHIQQERDHVTVTIQQEDGTQESVNAAWLIACDGAHSTIRHLLNAEFEGASYPERWWLADVHIHWDEPSDKMIIHASKHGPMAAFPMDNQRYRLVMTAPKSHQGDPEMSDIVTEFHLRSSSNATLSNPVWLTEFSIHHRQIQHYRDARVFFCGDAAHIHSPLGGQGLNTGIQDAYNLIWKLALVHKQQARQALLDTYHQERYPIGRQVLKKTGIMTHMILIKNPWLIAIRNAFISGLTSCSGIRNAIARDLAELTISYKNSSIVKKSSAKYGFKPGHDIPINSFISLNDGIKRTFSTIFRGMKHHLLLFIGNISNIDAINQQAKLFARQFDHSITIHIVLPYHMKHTSIDFSVWIDQTHILDTTTTAILIRPDQYVAMVQSPLNWHDLRVYLAKIYRA